MTDTTAHDDPDREHDLGALSRLFSFEEVDDAIELLIRLSRGREEEDAETGAGVTYPQAGLKINSPVYDVITQLQTVRRFHAIPEAALEAAYAAAGHPIEDDEDDQEPES